VHLPADQSMLTCSFELTEPVRRVSLIDPKGTVMSGSSRTCACERTWTHQRSKAESRFLSAFDALLEYFIYPAVGDLSH
jgi:hypothetical protein